ncbi:hypothetical protein LCGC14_1082890 [marine sediment metagenome]|uniref:Uncharacterized protein n=1 Tax=marine sediment metagenome TaxID=412755 RepID=A0A0F9N2C4_9ZZZZ
MVQLEQLLKDGTKEHIEWKKTKETKEIKK